MVGVAVKVTLAPAQIVVAVALILVLGVTTGETVMVMLFELAVVCVTQLALLVSTQLTTAPFARLLVVNEAELVPALLPFTFHW